MAAKTDKRLRGGLIDKPTAALPQAISTFPKTISIFDYLNS